MNTEMTNRGLQIAAAIILIVLVAVFLIQTYGKATRDIGYDFTSYLLSADALAHGHNPYATGSVFQYVYPLFLACLLIPLTFVPYAVAVVIWYLIALGSLVGSLWIVLGLTRDEQHAMSGRELIIPLCGIALMLIPVIQTNLLNGQVNFLVLLLCTLFLKFHHDRRSTPAALMLAMAIAIKLFPAILLLFVLPRRRYGECLLTLAIALAICVLPALLMGHQGFNVIREYWQTVLPGLHAEVAMPNAGRINFSLSGMIAGATPLILGTWWLNLISALAVVLSMAVIQFRSRLESHPHRLVTLFSLYLLAMLLISPLSEVHHMAYLMPAVIILIGTSTGGKHATGAQRIAIPAIFLVLFWLGELTDLGFFFFCSVIFLMVVLLRNVMPMRRFRRSPA